MEAMPKFCQVVMAQHRKDPVRNAAQSRVFFNWDDAEEFVDTFDASEWDVIADDARYVPEDVPGWYWK